MVSLAHNLKLLVEWWQTWRRLPVVAWIKAAACYRRGDFERAAVLYARGLERHGSHPAAWCARLDLSYALFRVGRYLDAERELLHVVRHHRENREAHLRLAKLQVWLGRPLDACWTIRRALTMFGGRDSRIVASFLIAVSEVVVESQGHGYLVEEALSALKALSPSERRDARIEIALARLTLARGDTGAARERLSRLAAGPQAPFDAVVGYAEVLLEEGRVAYARQQLRRTLQVAPNHPRVLLLLARSYLVDGPFYNALYGNQLATSACQSTGWMGPRELKVLAVSYNHLGDKLSALLIAHRAKEASDKIIGNTFQSRELELLIAHLSDQGGAAPPH